MNYQWRKDGTDLSGATGATLNLSAAQVAQTGSYTVVVCNLLGSVTSAPPVTVTAGSPAPGAVLAWGANGSGQTTVPGAAQSGVVAIVAGGYRSGGKRDPRWVTPRP